ncbi:hypothetical protein CVIRNUC_010557 [Coccomyxa viridis]|uniref:Uncharacterized protein n=1 Tax=Coccomyxa viridis TaxID=1274662 RepID=A0AAV1IJ23_9CHLO|nr:hypothetical protein CVIRNUC_010557 [Coccomyxa viridis]
MTSGIHLSTPVQLQGRSCVCLPTRLVAHAALRAASHQQRQRSSLISSSLKGLKQHAPQRSIRLQCSAQQATGEGTLISKTEVPAFIPRQDLMDQLLRWARNEATDPDTIGKYGLPIKVEPYANRDGMLWGITVSILRDGALATEVGIRYDEEEVLKHDWVGRGADGFPTLEGNAVAIVGKHLEIRKLDSNPVDEIARTAIRGLCQELVAAINKYYAFGSAFVDDST